MTHADLPELPVATPPQSSPAFPKRRFWLPLLLQLMLITSVPAQAIYTHLTGRTVILQTAPIDPYNLLTGYSVTLNYTISRSDNLSKLPGWKDLPKGVESWNRNRLAEGSTVYLILEAPSGTASAKQPQPWKAVAISPTLPKQLRENQVSLKGRVTYGQINYGLETYYMPEERRDEVNTAIVESQRSRKAQPAVVEVKVDAQGMAVPLRIWVNGQAYEF